jgi:hypothetical protein
LAYPKTKNNIYIKKNANIYSKNICYEIQWECN